MIQSGNLENSPEEFQMLVYLLGGISSPSCACYALKRTASDNEKHFDQETFPTIKRNFYVDDCLKSVENVQEASQLMEQLSQLLAKGGFCLTKWISNSRNVIQSLPVAERAGSVKDPDIKNLPVEHALGIQWDVHSFQDCYEGPTSNKKGYSLYHRFNL